MGFGARMGPSAHVGGLQWNNSWLDQKKVEILGDSFCNLWVGISYTHFNEFIGLQNNLGSIVLLRSSKKIIWDDPCPPPP